MAELVEMGIVGLYFLLVIGIGIYFKDKRDIADYWRAGGKIPTVVNSVAIFAATASGGAFLGMIGISYSFGAPFVWAMAIGTVAAFLLAAVLIGKPLRSMNGYTIIDIYDEIYGSKKVNVLLSVVVIVGLTIYLIAQLTAAGHVTGYLLDLTYPTAVILAGIIFILYVAIGGMWAITVTDFLQGIMMWGLILVISGYSLSYFGSISAPLTETPSIAAMAPIPLASYAGFMVIFLTSILVFPHIIMRVFSSESPESAKLSLTWMAFLFGAYSIVAFYLIPSAAMAINPELQQPDLALITVMETLLPAIVAGLTAAAILAAVMSTTDALLLAIAATISNDIYRTVLKPETSDDSVVNIGTLSVVGFGLLATGLAAMDPPELLVELFTEALAFMASTMVAPLLLGIWWKRANTPGALAAIVFGGICYVVLYPFAPLFAPILVSLPVSFVAMLVVSLVTDAPSADTIARRGEQFNHIDYMESD